MIKLSKSVKEIPHSPTLWANDLVHEKRAKGEKVFHMGFGESPFPVPERLKQSLADAAHRKDYVKADGLPELIEAVKDYYRPIHGDDFINQSDVIIAPGSKLILYALQMAIEGDLLMPVPSWVSYDPQARMLHKNVIKVPTVLDDAGFHIDAKQLEEVIRDARTKGLNPSKIIINSPNNPTGLCIPRDELIALGEVCEREKILIISDEIYGFVNFNGQYDSVAPFSPSITAVTTGLSKHLSLGGWRLGVGFIPKSQPYLFHALRCIISETWSCVSAPIQLASVDAYKDHQDIETYIHACTEIHGFVNRTISWNLQRLGIKAPLAQGAFYNYPDFDPHREALREHGIMTSQDLHETLLAKYNLATLPGHAFGAELSDLTLRLSGCDYDGAKAVEAFRAGVLLDDAFLNAFTPNVMGALEIFKEFLEDCGVSSELPGQKGFIFSQEKRARAFA